MDNQVLKPIGTALSKENNLYEVNVITEESEDANTLQNAEPKSLVVNWPAPSKGKCSPEETNAVHIEHYEIKKGGVVYKNELIFKANKAGSEPVPNFV